MFKKKSNGAIRRSSGCGVKIKIQKTLILAFDVIVQPPVYPHNCYYTIFPLLFQCVVQSKNVYFYFQQPQRHQKPLRNLQKLRLDQLKNPLRKGHGPMWPRKRPLQRLKPALPVRWPHMFKNNNDENLDKPCLHLEWYVKIIIFTIYFFNPK